MPGISERHICQPRFHLEVCLAEDSEQSLNLHGVEGIRNLSRVFDNVFFVNMLPHVFMRATAEIAVANTTGEAFINWDLLDRGPLWGWDKDICGVFVNGFTIVLTELVERLTVFSRDGYGVNIIGMTSCYPGKVGGTTVFFAKEDLKRLVIVEPEGVQDAAKQEIVH